MSLNLSKLIHVVRLEGGGIRAQCPACAEAGHDKRGEHLFVFPDGGYGCCVHQGNHEHRRRIYALAGEHKPSDLRIYRQAMPQGTVRRDILRHINPSLRRPTEANLESTGASEEVGRESCHTVASQEERAPKPAVQVASLNPEQHQQNRIRRVRFPYIDATGTVIIPFDSPEKYHWWDGGQSVAETRAELLSKRSSESFPHPTTNQQELFV
jgi:hypothetical protein